MSCGGRRVRASIETSRRSEAVSGRERVHAHAEVTLDRQKLKEQIHELYRSEHDAMGERGTLERLERGREWDLAPALAAGGVVVFPHAGVLDCGHQVAAAVHGCLDSGADRVIVISVLHAFTDGMETAASASRPGKIPPSGRSGESRGRVSRGETSGATTTH